VEHRPGTDPALQVPGTKAHKLDFERLIEPALARLFETHGGRIRIVVNADEVGAAQGVRLVEHRPGTDPALQVPGEARRRATSSG
jgi:hypothetical protein